MVADRRDRIGPPGKPAGDRGRIQAAAADQLDPGLRLLPCRVQIGRQRNRRRGLGSPAALQRKVAMALATAATPDDGAARTPKHHKHASHSGDLVRAVRESTRRFHDVNQAKAEGYLLMFGCVSGPDDGAMGLHYVNLQLVGDGVLDPARPEIVIYEPVGNGQVRLVGADYLVFADAWDKTHASAPELMGQKFQDSEVQRAVRSYPYRIKGAQNGDETRKPPEASATSWVSDMPPCSFLTRAATVGFPRKAFTSAYSMLPEPSRSTVKLPRTWSTSMTRSKNTWTAA